MSDKNTSSNPGEEVIEVDVIFRVLTRKDLKDWSVDNKLFAMFPEFPGTNEYDCYSYAWDGFGSCSTGIVQESRLAKPEEYADMKKHIERNFNYKLRIKQRIHSGYLDIRRKYIKECDERRKKMNEEEQNKLLASD